MPAVLNSILALLFLIGAAVQYNDPDPLRWMAVYLAASSVCVLAAMKRLHWWYAAAVAAVAFVWALPLAPRAFPNVRIPELFAAWKMTNERVEEGREMYGLLLISICTGALALTRFLRRQDPRVGSQQRPRP